MNAQTPIKPGDKVVTVHEAKTHLSRLIAEVEAGGDVVIARGKVPVARIVSLHPPVPRRRVAGWLAHELPPGVEAVGPKFWEPLSDEEMGLGPDPLLDKKR